MIPWPGGPKYDCGSGAGGNVNLRDVLISAIARLCKFSKRPSDGRRVSISSRNVPLGIAGIWIVGIASYRMLDISGDHR